MRILGAYLWYFLSVVFDGMFFFVKFIVSTMLTLPNLIHLVYIYFAGSFGAVDFILIEVGGFC